MIMATEMIIDCLEAFTLDVYEKMIDTYGLSKTWSRILNLISDKTVEQLSENELLSFDNIGELYEIGLAHSNKISKKDMGKYYTPKDVCILMAELLLENEINAIADIGCGTGNLVISVLSALKEKTGIDPIDFIHEGRLYLYDVDSLAVNICLTKIDILLGKKVSQNVNVIIGDFLDKRIALPPNISVITNPPYAVIKEFGKKWNVDEVLLQAKDLYAGFMNKIMNYCKNAVIVSPQSYLVASKFSKLRKKLGKKFCGEIFSFDNVPGTLFNGRKKGIFNTNSANGVRAAITSLKSNGQQGFKLTHLIRFRNDQRSEVINLNFLRSKLGTQMQEFDEQPIKAFKELEPMLEEIIKTDAKEEIKYISDLIQFEPSLQNPNYKLYVSTSARYFTLASKKSLKRKGYFTIYGKDENSFDILYLLINSSYAYMWWRFSDGGIYFTKRNLFSIPYHKKMLDKVIEIEDIVATMISKENDFVSYKLNAGERQESIKFPEEYRYKINKALFPKYAEDMKLLHKNYEVVNDE